MSLRITEPNSQEGKEHLLVAHMDNARVLSTILKTVQFRELATCFLSATGFKVTVEQAKCVQANAFIQAAMFQLYSYNDDKLCVFRININALIECLSIFGGSGGYESHTALKMYYDGHGNPLRLLLEENGVITDCSIQTLEPDETLDFDFTSANVSNKIIMKSECMKEAFSEIDLTSDILEIIMSPSHPFFRLATYGDTGNTQFDYPKDSDMMEVFECQQTQSNRYKLSLLKPSVKALNQSSKISVRMDKRGFLSLQYMIITDNQQVCFVEYLCVPDEQEEEQS